MDEQSMREQIRKWIVFLTLIGTVLGVMLSCRLYDDRVELEKDSVSRYFSIDPDTILESLAQGHTEVFTQLAATPEGELPSSEKSILWSQEDFFLVAETVHEQAWGEPFGDHNLYKMLFHVNCGDADQRAFSDAEFSVFKAIQAEKEEETRLEHWISIWPEIDLVYTIEAAYHPNVNYKVPIELSQYRVSASEALQIAEDNGGGDTRTKAGNDCSISVRAPGPDGMGWRVSYSADGFTLLFAIAVDPQIGEYNVLYPKSK